MNLNKTSVREKSRGVYLATGWVFPSYFAYVKREKIMRGRGWSYQCRESVWLCDFRMVLTGIWSRGWKLRFRQNILCQPLIWVFLKRTPKNDDLSPKTPWTKTNTSWTKTKTPWTKTKTPWTKTKTPWTKTKTPWTKTKTPWTKTSDSNRWGQCPLS